VLGENGLLAFSGLAVFLTRPQSKQIGAFSLFYNQIIFASTALAANGFTNQRNQSVKHN